MNESSNAEREIRLVGRGQWMALLLLCCMTDCLLIDRRGGDCCRGDSVKRKNASDPKRELLHLGPKKAGIKS